VPAGVGDRESDLLRHPLYAALAIGEHVHDLDPAPARERLSDPGELIEELRLDPVVSHRLSS
jgi:hypothetical protein